MIDRNEMDGRPTKREKLERGVGGVSGGWVPGPKKLYGSVQRCNQECTIQQVCRGVAKKGQHSRAGQQQISCLSPYH